MALYVVYDINNSYITQFHADDVDAARGQVTGMLHRNQPVGHVHRIDKGPDGSGEDWTDVTADVLDADAAFKARRGGAW